MQHSPPPMPQPQHMLSYAHTRQINFASGHHLALWAMGLLGAATLLSAATFVGHMMQLKLLTDYQRGIQPTAAQIHSNDIRQAVLAVLMIAIIVATAVIFLMWMYRVYRNLYSFTSLPLRFTPGWVVGYWFIPVINLFRPYQAMSEIWNTSRGPTDGGGAIVAIWWLLWVFSGITERIVAMVGQGRDEVENLVAATRGGLAGSVLGVLAGICAIIMVWQIDRMQDRTAMNAEQTATPAAYSASAYPSAVSRR